MTDNVQEYIDLVEGTLSNALDHIGHVEQEHKHWKECIARIKKIAEFMNSNPEALLESDVKQAGQEILQEVRDLGV